MTTVPDPIILPLDSGDTVTVYVNDAGEIGCRFDGPHFDGDNVDLDIAADGLRLVESLFRAATRSISGVLARNPHSVPNDAPLGSEQ